MTPGCQAPADAADSRGPTLSHLTRRTRAVGCASTTCWCWTRTPGSGRAQKWAAWHFFVSLLLLAPRWTCLPEPSSSPLLHPSLPPRLRPAVRPATQVEGRVPPGRHSHCAGGLEEEGCLVVYGGASLQGPLSDAWVYSSKQRRWTALTPGAPQPAAREMAAAVMVGGGCMFVHGGRRGDGRCGVATHAPTWIRGQGGAEGLRAAGRAALTWRGCTCTACPDSVELGGRGGTQLAGATAVALPRRWSAATVLAVPIGDVSSNGSKGPGGTCMLSPRHPVTRLIPSPQRAGRCLAAGCT